MEYYSAKKGQNYVICGKMEGTGEHVKQNKSDSERQIPRFLLY
jgi:hypothetical protein